MNERDIFIQAMQIDEPVRGPVDYGKRGAATSH